MKLNHLLLGSAMLGLIGIASTSCTNEMVNPMPGNSGGNTNSSMLVQNPEVYAWSGQQNLTSTRGFTRADGPAGSGTTPIPSNQRHFHNDEVEVNYSINDVHTDKNGQKYANADLWTKLSIHVRKGSNVKIDVPLPVAYHCASDDFAIFQTHLNGLYGQTPGSINEAEGFYSHSLPYVISDNEGNDWTVILYVKITEAGMSIWTEGIDENLIDYLFETNGDGLNFEIWNYYDTNVVSAANGSWVGSLSSEFTDADMDMFRAFLDNSTITFLNGNAMPSYYINAYGYDPVEKGQKRARDCRVTPNPAIYGGMPLFERYPYYCYHLNGTPWNVVWSFFQVDKNSDCYKAHTNTPSTKVEVEEPMALPNPAPAPPVY